MKFLIGLAIFSVILLSAHGFTAYTWLISLKSGIPKFWYWTIWTILGLSFIVASLIDYWLPGFWARTVYAMSATWLGIFFFFFLGAVILWILRIAGVILHVDISKTFVPHIILVLVGIISLWGFWNAMQIRTSEVTIPIKDLPEIWQERKIVLISDVHIGRIRQRRFLDNLAKKIDRLSPDLIVITGDLIDHGISDITEYVPSFKLLKSRFGVLYVTGNHEIMGNEESIKESLRLADFSILENEVVAIDGLSFWGVGYPPLNTRRHHLEVPDLKHPTILLHHSPVSVKPHFDLDPSTRYNAYANRDGDFSFEQALGVSLILTGHTHAGQIFPLNLLTRYLFDGYDRGLSTFSDLYVYTTSGITPWGPPFRTVHHSEIVAIRLSNLQ